ncbi:MAG: protein-disulfide reductase DsbD domain-containing protein, partial [Pseudomonadota bacterium]
VVDRPAVASVALVAADRMQRGHHGPRQHLSQGRVFASAQHVTGATRLSLRIEPGWHINAVEPLQDYLTATEVTLLDADGTALAQQPAVSLPPPTRKKLDYSPTELLLHDGEVQVDVPTAGAHAIGLTLQACSNDVCLPPTTAQFRLPVQP